MSVAVRPERESFEMLVRERGPRFRQSDPLVRPSPLSIRRPHIPQDESLPIEITEGQSEYRIMVPLAGIDPRKIYVFATPRSLLIEIRFKSTVCHELAHSLVTETVDKRISRELALPVEIEQGATTARVSDDALHITARKSEREQEISWSQLIDF